MTSKKYTRSSTPKGTEPRPVMVRVADQTYEALQLAAFTSNSSLNFVANEALTWAVAQPEWQARVQAKLTEAQETITKLSGDTS